MNLYLQKVKGIMGFIAKIFKSKVLSEDQKKKYMEALKKQDEIDSEIVKAIRVEQKAYRNKEEPVFNSKVGVKRLGQIDTPILSNT